MLRLEGERAAIQLLRDLECEPPKKIVPEISKSKVSFDSSHCYVYHATTHKTRNPAIALYAQTTCCCVVRLGEKEPERKNVHVSDSGTGTDTVSVSVIHSFRDAIYHSGSQYFQESATQPPAWWNDFMRYQDQDQYLDTKIPSILKDYDKEKEKQAKTLRNRLKSAAMWIIACVVSAVVGFYVLRLLGLG